MNALRWLFPSVATALLGMAPIAQAMDHGGHDHAAGGAEHDHATAAKAPASAKGASKAQVIQLTVTKEGFEPSTVAVKAGKPVKLVVTRKVEKTCATEIVMKDFGVNQPLPLDKPVTVEVTPKKPGEYRFACGMDMLAGTLKAE